MPGAQEHAVPAARHQRGRAWVSVFAALGLFALGFLAHYALRDAGPSAPSGPPGPAGQAAGDRPSASAPAAGRPGGMPVAVETARAQALDLPLLATAVASLRAKESVILRPETAGRIAAIHFRDGATVRRGELLLSLDASLQEAELAQAKANLGLAQLTFKRQQELFARNFISGQALDSAAASLAVQEAALALAQAKFEQTRIRAPFAGVVGIGRISVGDYVKEGQDLVNVEDISALKVDFRLPDAYLGQVRRGQTLAVTSDALPGQRFTATLAAVDPLIEASGRSLSCRAQLDNRGGKLRPGLFARVRLELGERRGALLVPEEAIVPDARSPFVYRVVEGKALRTPVQTGLRRDGLVEIVGVFEPGSGAGAEAVLKAGDEVVTAGQLKLRDGAPVRVLGDGNGKTAAGGEGGKARDAAGSGR